MYRLKTAMLMAALTVLLVLIGQAIGGSRGMMGFFVIALLMNVFSYWFSDKIVLAMYHAKPVTEAEAPELYTIVRNLAQKAAMPMPARWPSRPCCTTRPTPKLLLCWRSLSPPKRLRPPRWSRSGRLPLPRRQPQPPSPRLPRPFR